MDRNRIREVSPLKKETRSCVCEVRAERDEKHGCVIVGHPVVYEQDTILFKCGGEEIHEVIDRGAIDEKTDLKDVRFLVGHNTEMIPLARSRNNNENSTMQLSPDEKGLGMRADMDTENNMTARELWSAAGRGDITGMSFMFTIDKYGWEKLDTDKPVRHVQHISKIFEVSAVCFPAYEGAELDIEAASEDRRLESLVDSLESARKQLAEQRAATRDKERREAALKNMRR